MLDQKRLGSLIIDQGSVVGNPASDMCSYEELLVRLDLLEKQRDTLVHYYLLIQRYSDEKKERSYFKNNQSALWNHHLSIPRYISQVVSHQGNQWVERQIKVRLLQTSFKLECNRKLGMHLLWNPLICLRSPASRKIGKRTRNNLKLW